MEQIQIRDFIQGLADDIRREPIAIHRLELAQEMERAVKDETARLYRQAAYDLRKRGQPAEITAACLGVSRTTATAWIRAYCDETGLPWPVHIPQNRDDLSGALRVRGASGETPRTPGAHDKATPG